MTFAIKIACSDLKSYNHCEPKIIAQSERVIYKIQSLKKSEQKYI